MVTLDTEQMLDSIEQANNWFIAGLTAYFATGWINVKLGGDIVLVAAQMSTIIIAIALFSCWHYIVARTIKFAKNGGYSRIYNRILA